MSTLPKTSPSRRPSGDLIDAIVENMRANLEQLRYSIVAPSRYTVYLSQTEFERLQGLVPRLRAEAIRALDEELARLNHRLSPRRAIERLFGRARSLEPAEGGWHVEFLPDFDDELEHEQDILVVSELVLSNGPEVGWGAQTRRVSTVRAATGRQRDGVPAPPAAAPPEIVTTAVPPAALARLTYRDGRGSHQFDVVRDSTTIGRGGLRFPVDVRVAASDEVSREHARIRRDAVSGTFFLIDLSTHGTTIDGVPVPRGFDDLEGSKRENGTEARLPDRARIGLAGTVFLDFETQR
jgi:hypothetical protein